MHTFLSQPSSLVRLKVLCAALPFHRGITLSLRVVENHRLVKEFESLDFLDRTLGSLDVIEYYESLTFRFQVLLGY